MPTGQLFVWRSEQDVVCGRNKHESRDGRDEVKWDGKWGSHMRSRRRTNKPTLPNACLRIARRDSNHRLSASAFIVLRVSGRTRSMQLLQPRIHLSKSLAQTLTTLVYLRCAERNRIHRIIAAACNICPRPYHTRPLKESIPRPLCYLCFVEATARGSTALGRRFVHDRRKELQSSVSHHAKPTESTLCIDSPSAYTASSHS